MPFAEAPPPQRRVVPDQDAIWVVKIRVLDLFFQLKSFIGVRRALGHELVPKLWSDESPRFSARVWMDWQADGEGLTVKKKETVQVLLASNTPYWFCPKRSGEKGFVLSSVLEPIE
jgi:hypothetical protein